MIAMRRYTLILVSLFTFSCVHAQVYGTNNGSISFSSDAPLELIRASSNEMKGRVDMSKKIFAFSIRISSFNGFNSPLQKEHFNENYMESVQFPNASFSGRIIEDIDLTKDGSYTVRAKGNLTIHGVTQERIIKSDLVVKDGKVSLHSNFTVLLSEHNILIPKVVHEKLASEIKVEVKAELSAS
ncbi:MAG TPA: YceI family protein [Ferruginibacter sp.]|nr:YceI family protein [Ferruginibacter sp.]HNF43498.1 YceI family protein [Ferruginibacter sp.]HNH20702.1 YceI family protein [Ferruginibacter sp.]